LLAEVFSLFEALFYCCFFWVDFIEWQPVEFLEGELRVLEK
jgi:hypothetical protein